MSQGSRLNSLIGPDMHPWHLKISFTIEDEKGKDVPGTGQTQGTIEELWASPQKSRITYAAAQNSQTIYVTESGVVATGVPDPLSELIAIIRSEFVEPLPDAPFLAQHTFTRQERTIGNAHLACPVLSKPKTANAFSGSGEITYCFESDVPRLRIRYRSASPWALQAVRNNLIAFQGRFIPKDVRFLRNGKEVMTAHLGSLESLPTVDDASFALPADNSATPYKAVISGRTVNEARFLDAYPVYPVMAKQAHVSGTVVLHLVIDEEGHPKDLHAVSGPPTLIPAAIGAVQQWTFIPFTLNGARQSVESTTNIVFNLGD
jgi:TonB family protein